MRPVAAAPLALALPSLATPQGAPDLGAAFSDLLHDAEGSGLPEGQLPVAEAPPLTVGPALSPLIEAQVAPSASPATPSLALLDPALPLEEGVEPLDDGLDEEVALAWTEAAPLSSEGEEPLDSAPALGGELPWLALLAPTLPPAARAPAIAGAPRPSVTVGEGVVRAEVAGRELRPAVAAPSPAPHVDAATPARPEPVAVAASAPRAITTAPIAPSPAAAPADPSPGAVAPIVAAPPRLPAPSRDAVAPVSPPAAAPSTHPPAPAGLPGAAPEVEPVGLALRAEAAAPQAAASRADGPNWSWAVVTQAIRPKAPTGPISPPLAAARASRTWDSTPWFPQSAAPTEAVPPPVDAPLEPLTLAEAPPEIALAPGASPPPSASPAAAAPTAAAPSLAPPAPDQAELLDSMLPARLSDELDVVVREAEGLVRVHLSAHNQSMSVHLRAPEALVGGFQALAPELDAALGEAGYSLDSFEAEADGGDPRPDAEAEPEPRGSTRRPAEESAAGRDSSVHRVV